MLLVLLKCGDEFIDGGGLVTSGLLAWTLLLMLVSALAGKANIDRAYAEDIEHQYRFFSFGDAMFIR